MTERGDKRETISFHFSRTITVVYQCKDIVNDDVGRLRTFVFEQRADIIMKRMLNLTAELRMNTYEQRTQQHENISQEEELIATKAMNYFWLQLCIAICSRKVGYCTNLPKLEI